LYDITLNIEFLQLFWLVIKHGLLLAEQITSQDLSVSVVVDYGVDGRVLFLEGTDDLTGSRAHSSSYPPYIRDCFPKGKES
jgi:hypothetical protein